MIARALYALAFCVAVPAILAAWAYGLDRVVSLPRVHYEPLGASLALVGVAIMLASMWALKRHGDGLPMNAFPPKRFVSRGVYAILAHPIYIGFTLACAGASVWTSSPAGLWIVTPTVALASWALVAGYERDAISSRFGAAVARPRLSISLPTDERPAPWDYGAALLLVFLPWLTMYEGVGHVPSPGAIDSHMAFEHRWPVWIWTESFYVSTYPWAVLAVFACRTKRDLRAFCLEALVATALGLILYLSLPFVAPPREFIGNGFWASLLTWERSDGLEGRASLPAFHVFWALSGARQYAKRFPRLAWACWGWGYAIATSCITTGMHSLADIAVGVLFALLVWRWRNLWRAALRMAQVAANSWREWHLGPVRVIVHGIYAGLGALVGMLIWGTLVGGSFLPWLALVALAGMVGGALWGQALEGAAVSLRPFGYYGHLIGSALAIALLASVRVLDWRAVAALAVAAPWIQALGRLRCLVQGCCHGRAITGERGIVYQHPMSRACRVGLAGIPVHATPLYSIVANVVVGVLVIRLWSVGATAGLVVGAYLILSGISRFVEEHFRGEPQTRVLWGLRLYQWFAVVCVLLGMVISAVPGHTVGGVHWNWAALAWSLAVALAYLVAMGVDFPRSSRRFSRLA